MNIKEAILQRKSKRTFKEEAVPQELKQNLKNYISYVESPFKTKEKFMLLDLDENCAQMKLGTYGTISGAKTFIAAITEKGVGHEESLGYAFEKIILYATALSLGTCWLGGSFNRSEFSKAVNLKKDELIPVVSPVGYAKEKRSFMDFSYCKECRLK
jgi:nitroreductase